MDTYLLLKGLHIVGVVLFLGNIIVTGWWKVTANRTRNLQVIAFAQRQVTLTDYLFTAGGALLLFAAGVANAELHGIDYWSTTWIFWPLVLFIVSGVIWVGVLIPIQIRQARSAREFARSGVIPAAYWIRERYWVVFGLTATVVPMAALYWMVFKPA